MRNQILVFIIIFITIIQVNAQKSNKLDLYIYLIQQDYIEEAHLLNESEILQNSIETNKLDSFYWWKANLFEKIKQFDSAAVYLSKIVKSSSYYPKNKFNAAFYYSINKEYNLAYTQLNEIQTSNKQLNNLKNVQFAALNILQRKIDEFDTLSKQLDTSFYATKSSIESLIFIKNDIQTRKKKSPLLATSLSAIVPGSGKFYAGKTGEAIAAFLTVGALGAMLYENANKYGLNHGRTYLSASAFGIFYIGNLFGSYYSINRENLSFNEKVEKNILYIIQHSNHNSFN